MSGLGGELIEHFKSMTINFAKVIGKEISNLEEDASVKYFQFYAISYYFSDLPEDSRPIPIGLAANLSRVGSSLMVACQNVYNIKLINV